MQSDVSPLHTGRIQGCCYISVCADASALFASLSGTVIKIAGRWLAGNRRGWRRQAREWLVQAQAPADLDITQNGITAQDAHQPPGVIHHWQLVHVAAGH